MNINGSGSVSGAAAPLDPQSHDVDRAEIRRLAQEFEAMLMTQMLQEMRRSMLDDEEGETESLGFGANTLMETVNVELGNALSRAGGIGLTDALLKAFERQITGHEQPDDVARPVAEGMPGPVSSGFGWRRDPFTGASQFHSGVDIALAYGQDVLAAANGTVSFAGEQHGYGQTVVVNHGDGRQTRYAHLSAHLVRTGDIVSEGQVLGRSGSSGRSTGPHLHFEMLMNGRPVDPSVAGE